MEFPFDVISEDEYARQRASYAPLTESLRGLIDAGIHTAVDDAHRPGGLGHLEAATALLSRSNGSRRRRCGTPTAGSRWRGRIP